MNQDKIGEFIKNLRKDNNLTQQELANKLGVTYQAVSKWENGKNIPDISILKAISEMFNVNIDEILNGSKENSKKPNKKIIYIVIFLLLILLSVTIIHINKNYGFEFKTIKSECSEFKANGSAAYNKNKSSIYIPNIEYCGKDDSTIYTKIECSLYSEVGTTQTIISEESTENDTSLKDYLKDVSLRVDSKTCLNLKNTSIYLMINATDKNNKVITYKVPLVFDDDCTK